MINLGLDLVELQIRIAEGYLLSELGVSPDTVKRSGHAIQCRLYAEDPLNNFFPSPGRLKFLVPAEIQVCCVTSHYFYADNSC